MPAPRVELLNLDGRAQLVREGRMIDVGARSAGRFGSDPRAVLGDFARFCDWARGEQAREGDPQVDAAALGPAVPDPTQLFAIGLNYRAHAAEAGLPVPTEPMVFTKFASCLLGPRGQIRLTSDTVDWEVELVVVIGQGGARISEARALEAVAGYAVGQDISDRRRQFGDAPPQFSLGKSAAGFGPVGPGVVSLDSLDDALDLPLYCDIDGVRQQDSRTSDMIFAVPELVSYLSRWCTLRPGDLIFTGTPSGVGSVQKPRRYLKAGELIRTEISPLGVMEHRAVE
jgi:2,4-diketo-3-deoxy-L-fuconate hydrolase